MIPSLATSSLFTTHPQYQFIHINDNAVFECAANGSESLTIKWVRNNGQIPEGRFQISNTTRDGGITSVLKVSKSTVGDSGFYWCIATNADYEKKSSQLAELLSKIGSIYFVHYSILII